MKSSWKKYLSYIGFAIIASLVIYVFAETVKANNTGFETKTLWDWMELLIVPLFLAGGAFYLNRSDKESERQRTEERAKLEREIATDRQQEAALQSYLDRMADLLVKDKLRTTKNKEILDVARARTLSVLRSLDSNRKGFVLSFLHEAKIIMKTKPIISLDGADLRGANLFGAKLEGINLSKANLHGANLSWAKLEKANLRGANLRGANLEFARLSGADLSMYANLSNSNLSHADLSGAKIISTDLIDADLWGANLSGADLWFANLRRANLRDADLTDARLKNAHLSAGTKAQKEQLKGVKSLKGAIMPNGTKHD